MPYALFMLYAPICALFMPHVLPMHYLWHVSYLHHMHYQCPMSYLCTIQSLWVFYAQCLIYALCTIYAICTLYAPYISLISLFMHYLCPTPCLHLCPIYDLFSIDAQFPCRMSYLCTIWFQMPNVCLYLIYVVFPIHTPFPSMPYALSMSYALYVPYAQCAIYTPCRRKCIWHRVGTW
jgi:hypothetical protein